MHNEHEAPQNVRQLVERYLQWAEGYYRLIDGRRSRHINNLKYPGDAMIAVAGNRPPGELRAEDVYAAQAWMVDTGIARRTINQRVQQIRAMLKWAAQPPRRWIPASVVAEANLVEPLKRGRTPAPETEGVHPVAWETVATTIAAADLELATAIELQWHTGMRPGEVARMRTDELDSVERDLWIYEPAIHKTAHHGVRRRIAIGPQGIAVLEPWLERMPPREKVFRWGETMAYTRAISRINDRLGIHWTPAQIRHSFATRLRAEAGLDAVQVALSHTSTRMSEWYGRPDDAAALQIIRQIG